MFKKTIASLLIAAGSLSFVPKQSDAAVAMIAIPPLAGATTAGIVIGAVAGGITLVADAAGTGALYFLSGWSGSIDRGEKIKTAALALSLFVLDAPERIDLQLEQFLTQKYPRVAAADPTVIHSLSEIVAQRLDTASTDQAGHKVVSISNADVDAALNPSDLRETASPAVRTELDRLKRDLI